MSIENYKLPKKNALKFLEFGEKIFLLFALLIASFLVVSSFRHDSSSLRPDELPVNFVTLDEWVAPSPDDFQRLDLNRGSLGRPRVAFPGQILLMEIDLSKAALLDELSISFFRAKRATVFQKDWTDKQFAAEVGDAGLKVNLSSITHVIGAQSPSLFVMAEIAAISKPTIQIGTPSQFKRQYEKFQKNGAFLAGAMLVLAVFALTFSLLAKDFVFFIFSIWVLTTLRVTLISGGWDLTWLGIRLSPNLTDTLLRTTLALHPIVSFALFRVIFWSVLPAVQKRICMVITGISFSLFIVASFSTYAEIMSVIWGVSVVAGFGSLAMVARTLFRLKSRSTWFYFTGWAVSLLGIFAEILHGAGLMPSGFRGYANGQVSGLVSVLLIAAALAERFNLEKVEKLFAQQRANSALKKYQQTYDIVPVGLFSLSPQGIVTHYNPKFAAMFDVEEKSKSRKWDSIIPSFPLPLFPEAAEGSFEFSTLHGNSRRWFEVQTLRQNDIIEGTIAEITERKLGEQQLQYAAHYDQLTSLHNRHFMIKRLDQMLGSADGPNTHIGALVMVDIERFHQVVPILDTPLVTTCCVQYVIEFATKFLAKHCWGGYPRTLSW